ncbi:MAG: metal ABC transporter permease [Candidatus Thermoplasmatota archaeon]|nr:metal ABC transporter permease [Candidatus Thermoplasmatota archaeon]
MDILEWMFSLSLEFEGKGPGGILLEFLSPILEFLGPMMPGEVFPYFFTMAMFQRALVASLIVSIVAGFLGTFLLVRNLSLIGDGLAHVSFGGVAVGIVLGGVAPLWYALIFSILAAIIIDQMQTRNLLTGDASIAIFLTGTLGLGLVTLRIWGGGITTDVEGYLFGSLLLIDEQSLDLITTISIISLVSIITLYHSLLAISVDPIAARVQGIPVRSIGLYFSIITAAAVVSMVQIVGVLLVTAILVTPSATAQLLAKSFRSCIIWSQIIGISGILLGLYLSAEKNTGSGSMIALVSATIFFLVLISQIILKKFIQPTGNFN